MSQTTPATEVSTTARGPEAAASTTWTTPRFEVISLDCEITAYAPEGDQPLF